jgi:type IV pilus assembly protein PilM
MNLLGPRRILAVDIGAGSVKLAEFMVHRTGLELMTLGARSLGLEPDKDADPGAVLQQALRELVAEHAIRPAPTALSVSFQSAFVRTVKLPPVKKEKVHQTVAFEAEQNVPFPINEVVWDYQLTGTPSGELTAVLVAIKADIVNNITQWVTSAGLPVEVVDVVPVALYNAVRYSYGDLGGCTLVIDIGARSTSLVFMEKNQFFSRSLPVVGAGNAITSQLMKEFQLSFADAEQLKFKNASVAFGGSYEDYADKVLSTVSKTVRSAMTRLHVELERTINFYRNQQEGSRPDRVLLAGGSSVIARMDDFFREKLKLDVEYLNPFKNIVVNARVTDEALAAQVQAMGPVVGVSLRLAFPCPVEINLLPPAMVEEKEFRRKIPFLTAAAVGLVLLGACWWLIFSRLAKVTDARKQDLQQDVATLRHVEERLQGIERENQALRHKAEAVVEVVSKRAQWLEVLNGIQSCMLDGMWLVSIAPAGDGVGRPASDRTRPGPPRAPGQDVPEEKVVTQLELRGMIFADKANDTSIQSFRDQLRNSKFFDANTEIKSAPLPNPGDVAREFTILLVLKNPIP